MTAINRFWTEFRLQLHMTVWHWSYLIVHLVNALVIFGIFAPRIDRSAEGMLNGSLSNLSVSLILLISILLSGVSASRPGQARFDEMAHTYPTGFELTLAGIAATTVACLGLLLEPLAMAAIVGPWPSLISGLFPYLLYYVVCAILGACFTWLLAALIPFRRWVYPLLAAFWAAFWLGPNYLGRFGINLAFLDLYDRLETVDNHSLFGLLEPQGLAIMFCLFYLGLALTFLSIAYAKTNLKRIRQIQLAPVILLLASFGLLFSSAIQFNQIRSGLQAQAARDYSLGENPAVSAWIIPTAYTVQADFSGDQAQIELVLTIMNQGNETASEASFILNPMLTVTSADMDFHQEGNLLSIQLNAPLDPGQSTDIRLSYAGNVRMYTAYFQESALAAEIFENDAVYTGVDSYWLPVSGADNLAAVNGSNQFISPVVFDLTILNRDGMVHFLNLNQAGPDHYHSDQITNLYWITSDRLVIQPAGMLTIIASRDDLPVIQSHLNDLNQYVAELQSYVPETRVSNPQILIGDSVHGQLISYAGRPENISESSPVYSPIITIPRIFLAYWQNSSPLIGYWITEGYLQAAFDQQGSTDTFSQASSEISDFLWKYHQVGQRIEDVPEFTAEPVSNALTKITAQYGQESIGEALQLIRQYPLDPEFDNEALAAWLMEQFHDR